MVLCRGKKADLVLCKQRQVQEDLDGLGVTRHDCEARKPRSAPVDVQMYWCTAVQSIRRHDLLLAHERLRLTNKLRDAAVQRLRGYSRDRNCQHTITHRMRAASTKVVC